MFNWTIPDPRTEYKNLLKKIFNLDDNFKKLPNVILKKIFKKAKLINSNNTWIIPAIIIDQANGIKDSVL